MLTEGVEILKCDEIVECWSLAATAPKPKLYWYVIMTFHWSSIY